MLVKAKKRGFGLEITSLLNPTENEIRMYVSTHEEDWKYSDKLIYFPCVRDTNRLRLCKIQEEDVKGPIRTFLLNWGMMGRVLKRKNYKGWEKRLAETLRGICNQLKEFRKLNLETTNISSQKDDIKKCYDAVSNIVKTTSASKTLHVICPNFFPLWDLGIRERVSGERRGLGKAGIGPSATGYYNFMVEIQGFLNRYAKILSELSRKYSKSKLRITDEFMWRGTDD